MGEGAREVFDNLREILAREGVNLPSPQTTEFVGAVAAGAVTSVEL